MSTKTTTKRFALATVVALGAGLLSIVSVSSASAAVNTAASSGANGLTVNANAADGITASATASIGLIPTSVSGTLMSSVATLSSSGKISVSISSATAGAGLQVASGGTISAATGDGSQVVQPGLTFVSSTSTAVLNVGITPTAGASQMIINGYTGLGASAVTSGAAGTLRFVLTVSIASANTAGVLSLTKSGVAYALSGTNNDPSTLATPGLSDFNAAQYGYVKAHDAYDTALLTADNHYVSVSASNGAYVMIGNGTPTKTAASGSFSGDFYISVKAGALATTGGSTTITVAIDGTTIGTLAFSWTGPVAKVVLSSAANGAFGSVATNTININYFDGLGNPIYFTTTNGASGTNSYPSGSSVLVADANGFKGLKTGLNSVASAFAASSTATQATVTFKCPSTNVTDAAQLDYINSNGTVVVSNSLPFSCSGPAYTYTAAFDKASYNPGDIATLAVTFKDSSGALAADGIVGAASGGVSASVTAGYMGSLSGGTAGANVATVADATTAGVLKYKFIVGQPTSTYISQASVLFPAVTGTTAAVTVPYTITAGGGTSLNDVLKGIVALIASINKQIAALAKLVSKK